MHPLFGQASGITHDIIAAAIEVHKDKGPVAPDDGTGTAEPSGAGAGQGDDPLQALKLTDGVSRLILPGANPE
jgi:hypothetical protein